MQEVLATSHFAFDRTKGNDALSRITYLPTPWSHLHLSLGNSLRIPILWTSFFSRLKHQKTLGSFCTDRSI